MRNDGAVSESIGFILILSIVMIGIAIVVLYGLPFIVTGRGECRYAEYGADDDYPSE